MAVAIILVAVATSLASAAACWALGGGAIATLATMPLAGSAAAVAAGLLILQKGEREAPTRVPGANSEPELFQVP